MNRDIRVLVGDDSADDRYFIGRAFQKARPDVTVDFARSGDEVIQILEDASRAMPSLLIIDSMMARKNGFDVVTWLRTKKEFEQMPVVMISGQLSERNAARAQELNVSDYIAKPDDLDSLENLIEGLARKYLPPAK
jgi:DNA-binding response OmpR family regulator